MAFFSVTIDEKLFISEVYLCLSKHIKNIITGVKTTEDIMKVKEHLSIFHQILNTLKINESN
jgi:hypothetical protein